MGLFNKVDILEARLQMLIEGSAARLFPDYNLENDLAHRLVAALQSGIKQHPEGYFIAPNLFTLEVHPSRCEKMQQQEGFFDNLTRTLETAASDADLIFLSPPVIRVVENNDLPVHQFRVSAQISQDRLAHTTDFLVEPDTEGQNIPYNAFLIVNGTQIIPLTRSVINIGRRPDNQMVIDDPRVSRVHSQLRAIKGRFVIFDLDSTGGTFVNSQRISQYTLFPGDVISLAGFPLVYGQDVGGPGGTQKFTPLDDNEI